VRTKSAKPEIIAFAERHYLKAFTHFTRQGERFDRLVQSNEIDFAIQRLSGSGGQLTQIICEQKLRL